ncbi:MAG: hypothetical protein M3383_10530, partial [Actinomycetota bacterium]|nr:hypothetical protein [Actinomycetota bacterium]
MRSGPRRARFSEERLLFLLAAGSKAGSEQIPPARPLSGAAGLRDSGYEPTRSETLPWTSLTAFSALTRFCLT